MMLDLTTESFFSLEGYAHADLFKETQFVWEALARLKSYLNHQVLGKIEIEVPPSVHLENPALISIGKGVRIEPNVYIQGPCIIGPGSVICHGAYVRENVITGERCTIGHDTEIKHSILLNGAKAAHFNYVGDSILGNETNLGAGVKCANLRLDRELVSVLFEGERISTELKKLGAIVGDGAQIGCNSVTNPGTLLGKGALCYPCLNIGGCIPSGSTVKPSYQCIVEK